MARSRRRLLVALALALPAPLLVACAGIVGLDELHKGECPGARCGDGGNLPENFVPEGSLESGSDAGSDSGRGTQPVSWAHWRMPNYEAGTTDVEVGPSYTTGDAGGGVGFVHDQVTGLTWLDANIPAASYDGAAAACAAQPNGKWRLPKRIELVTLLDFGRSGGALYNAAFKVPTFGPHWTSSESRTFGAAATTSYWTVDFGSGEVKPQAAGTQLPARCIKEGS